MKVQVCGFVVSMRGMVALYDTPDEEGRRYAGLSNGFGGTVEVGAGTRSTIEAYTSAQTEGTLQADPLSWTCFHQERYRNSDTTVHYMVRKMTEAEEADLRAQGQEKGPTATVSHAIRTNPMSLWHGCAPGLGYLLPMAWAYLMAEEKPFPV